MSSILNLLSTDQPADSIDDSTPRKRKRKTFACVVCRRRKLRCDQSYPTCTRCIKSNVPCVYGREEAAELAADNERRNLARMNTNSSNATLGAESAASYVRATWDKNRPPEVESTRDVVGFPIHPTLSIQRRKAVGTDVPETMIFKGKSFKTQFFGATHPVSQIAHFPELRNFLTEGVNAPGVTLARMGNDIRTLKAKAKKLKVPKKKSGDTDMLPMLPDEDTARRWSTIYFNQFETTYRVLHGPSFWKSFDEIARDPTSAKDSTLVILLLVMAIGRIIDPEEKNFKYIGGPNSKSRQQAEDAIDAASKWYEKHSRKHTSMEFFQVQILMCVAKNIAIVKKKQAWEDARAMITNSLAAGLHREPSLLGDKISIFHQEMRRRLWTTIVELELQASLERGMISSTMGMRWDINPPSNINDIDLSEDLNTPPEPKPDAEFTDSSFLRWSQRSIALRIALNAGLNDTPCQLSHDDMFEYEEQIEKLLDALPKWKKLAVGSNNADPETAKVILDIQLRQFVAMIHGYFVCSPGTESQQTFSAIANLNSSTSIISQYNELNNKGHYIHQLLDCNVLRVGLSICTTVCTSKTFAKSHSPLLQNLVPSAITSVEQALNMLKDEVLRLGQGIKEHWYLSAAYSVIQSRNPAASNTDQKQAAIERSSAIYYIILGSQEEILRANESALTNAESIGTDFRNNSITSQAFSEETTPQNAFVDVFSQADNNIFAMMDMSNWTLEDTWNFDF